MTSHHPHPWGRTTARLTPDDWAMRDYAARYAPTQPVTMGDVWAMTFGPVFTSQGRKLVAAAKAYKETL